MQCFFIWYAYDQVSQKKYKEKSYLKRNKNILWVLAFFLYIRISLHLFFYIIISLLNSWEPS
jgi:hypothetical protein